MKFGKFLCVFKLGLFCFQKKTVRQILNIPLSQTYKSIYNNFELVLKAWPCGHLFQRTAGVRILPMWNFCVIMLPPGCSYYSSLSFPSYTIPTLTTLKHHNMNYHVTFCCHPGLLMGKEPSKICASIHGPHVLCECFITTNGFLYSDILIYIISS